MDTTCEAPPRTGRRRAAPPAAGLAVAAMVFVQVGTAASTSLFAQVGTAGTAWLRLSWAAVIYLALVRPRLRALPPSALRAAGLLGAVTAGMTLCFLAAVERIPLGTAAAVEFLGPLAVAVARSSRRRNLLWPALAAAGIVGLTEPWTGATDLLGVGFALSAAAFWAAYILLTQHVGDSLSGSQGLAVSMPVAAVVAAVAGVPQALGHVTAEVVLVTAVLALLSPVIPFALELSALRRLTTAAFGTLMSLEPAVALLIGLLVLQQRPAPWQLGGVVLVVLAGIGAERTGRRAPGPAERV